MMLDRIRAEKARTTSLVRHAPDSHFPAHEYPGGEEILVLSDTFTENGLHHFPVDSYLRNPLESRHPPSSAGGCMIFVKLRQMPPEEHKAVRINTRAPANWHEQGGREICPLYTSTAEQVSLQHLSPETILTLHATGSVEILIIGSTLTVDDGDHPAGSWLCAPVSETLTLTGRRQCVTFYLKTGHLTAMEDA